MIQKSDRCSNSNQVLKESPTTTPCKDCPMASKSKKCSTTRSYKMDSRKNRPKITDKTEEPQPLKVSIKWKIINRIIMQISRHLSI